MGSDYFESDEALESYLLAHYGTPAQRQAPNLNPRHMAGSVVEFVTEPLRHVSFQHRRRALDLGCATGRGTFELRRFFDEVVGVDRSQAFISVAKEMREQRKIMGPLDFELPSQLATDQTHFKVGDACNLDPALGIFDLVMLTQLIDRVADPARCLEQMGSLVEAGGWLVISTACHWQEKFTPREKWLGKGDPGIVNVARVILAPCFELHHRFCLPYFIRARPHRMEWSIAEVSIWQRLSVKPSQEVRLPPVPQ